MLSRVSLKVSDQVTVQIQDLAFGGEGVGRLDDFVMFVPFVIVGETVLAEIERGVRP
jgi:23S rRNA (uracil1939-C5)-methyltransferase